jgi:CRISPR-associated endonuclease/helicase Cas3
MTYAEFFQAARGDEQAPYAYQCRLAGGEAADPKGAFLHGTGCQSQLINIPTGLGKTAAVVLAWLWNRVAQPDEAARAKWPRRLVYCLPMRTLVEQTEREVRQWLGEFLWDGNTKTRSGKVGVHVLMGGEDAGDWDIYPEENAILIGTQDMLLSKALNRGYASARARWPMEFGLLNHDCLWTLDEVQLMDVGLATTAQLQAFRRDDQLARKHHRPCVTWWMSATLRPEWLESADTKSMVAELLKNVQRIFPEERKGGVWSVSKACSLLPVKDVKAWAADAWKAHLASSGGEHGRITLIIANTVRTARELHAALIALQKKGEKEPVELRLIHSRFRGMERRAWRESFLSRSSCNSSSDRIIVATQVVEAGVDISATTLFAELAPWSSLVQRFGRAARYGGTAQVFVVDRNPSEKAALPYQLSELEAARAVLAHLPDASLAGLSAFEVAHADLLPGLFPYAPTHLLLRRELDELCDTTPDLSGADLDISRFIRSGDDRDVTVCWREVETVPDQCIKPLHDELCAVAVGDARDWLTSESVKKKAWVWDYLDGEWSACRKEDIYPGQTILVALSAGGYDTEKGWTGNADDRDFPLADTTIPPSDRRAADATEQSEATSQRKWESIAVHGWHVAQTVGKIADTLALAVPIRRTLELAARWHDFGKGHPAFQGCINLDAAHSGSIDIAKAPPVAWKPMQQLYKLADGEQRHGFRHELVTTLALFAVLERYAPQHPALLGAHVELITALGQSLPAPSASTAPTPPEQEILDLDPPAFDLLAYLACAHHGKVRGAWHAAPADQEYRARDERGLPIHGVRDEDVVPALEITAADGVKHLVPSVTLHLDPARIGLSLRTGASWVERVAGLLHTHGPFALTYFEALLRAADIRASRSSAEPATATD